jgi:hypothetical protein
MSIGTQVARCLCVVLAAGVARVEAAAAPNRDPHLVAASAPAVLPDPAAPRSGFLLDRLSKGDLNLWRAIEEVVAASDETGAPRSRTLRRLWDWARTSTHALHVEMVRPSRLPGGTAGIFRVERVDPAGRTHVVVIRLCPDNIRRAKAGRGPDPIETFVRFQGLTEVERFAEVVAHELAHAEYFLESPERLAQLEVAQGAIGELLTRAARAKGPKGAVYEELGRLSREPLAVLAACEAHAESVEAMVLRELAASAPSRTIGRVR